MVEWARTTAKNLGVKLVSRSSPSNRAYLTCDLFGVKRPSKTDTDVPNKRWSGTKKINCKFYLVGKQHYGDRWGIRILYGKHNHDPVHLFGHGSTKMTEEEVEITRMLAKSHVPPKKILIHLKEKNLAQDVHLRQIYNEKAKMKKEARGGHTIMPHLVGLLEEHKYYKWIRTDPTTHEVIDLMWAHPQSVEMLRLFPYVLLFDCTYKTNVYKMPLLEIIGVCSEGLNFTVAVAFMRHENEDHYTWALNNLRKLYLPNNVPGVVVTDRELGLIKGLENECGSSCCTMLG
ncbi:PREDICTED: protein FAR1-RELATED SEQUENCE 5-like [Erythranthe guttata]|uniref:protein FAR1-RELATED SEQUENCE 5-like n=1 Tax=Erythranthe guttata TaxID=4155 RepID=UPI00064DE682|nr:PREDICTED: protein FAR1-RELATED SEQUENCE 5-like [Erythranthe guttata]|eukprot:XP_012845629.1 PREDICTED: protein FAR1-RELATED SEQUENCE 5-like [Erythranthe guttata]